MCHLQVTQSWQLSVVGNVAVVRHAECLTFRSLFCASREVDENCSRISEIIDPLWTGLTATNKRLSAGSFNYALFWLLCSALAKQFGRENFLRWQTPSRDEGQSAIIQFFEHAVHTRVGSGNCTETSFSLQFEACLPRIRLAIRLRIQFKSPIAFLRQADFPLLLKPWLGLSIRFFSRKSWFMSVGAPKKSRHYTHLVPWTIFCNFN